MPIKRLYDWLKTIWWCSPLALPAVLMEQHFETERVLIDLMLKDIIRERENRHHSQFWRDRMIG